MSVRLPKLDVPAWSNMSETGNSSSACGHAVPELIMVVRSVFCEGYSGRHCQVDAKESNDG